MKNFKNCYFLSIVAVLCLFSLGSMLNAQKTEAGVTFRLEAQETNSSGSSCPWVAPWDGSGFVPDNDIYSVARGAANRAYTDYYKLMRPLVLKDGVYPVEVQELEKETSFTDYVSLILLDHAPGVEVAPDDKGNFVAYSPSSLISPTSAVAGDGSDVLGSVSVKDNTGFKAYSDDTVIVNFGNIDVSQGARLVLRAIGFLTGEGDDKPMVGPPAVIVETKDENGDWQERGRWKARFAHAETAFDLSSFLTTGDPVEVRLRSVSHGVKYHEIDYVAMDTGIQPPYSVTELSPDVATSAGSDILGTVKTVDSNYFEMAEGEKFYMEFQEIPVASGEIREFIFVSRGYYIPDGNTYYIYTYNAGWQSRGSYSYPSYDYTRDFDLSAYLPDSNGNYSVRVYNNATSSAYIDYVGLNVNGTWRPLSSATRDNYGNVLSLVNSSNNSYSSVRGYNSYYTFSVNSPPTANAGPNQTVNANSSCLASVTLNGSGSSDPDGDNLTYSWTWSGGSATGVSPTVTLPKGVRNVNLVVKDGTVNSASDTVVITVNDATAPSISVPADVRVECTGDTSSASTGVATGSDTCGGVAITESETSVAGPGNTEVITRTWTATDDSGNTASGDQIITVADATAPSISVPADVTVECTGDTSSASTGVATGSDTCGGVAITESETSVAGSGNTEVITRTWTATDDSGNTASGVQTITVVDTTDPSLTVPEDDNITPSGGPSSYTIESSDTCGGVVLTMDYSCQKRKKDGSLVSKPCEEGSVVLEDNTVTVIESGGVGNIITVTITSTDDSGNFSTDSFDVNVLRGDEGVGNGSEDLNTPGHDNNGGNDDPEFGPGNPGAKHKPKGKK